METYYTKNRDKYIQKVKAYYYAHRAEKLAYQKEYCAKKKASGWVPKKYPRKSRAKPKPEPKVILIPVPDEPEPPITHVPQAPKPSKKEKAPAFVWKEASFSMTLK